MSWNDIYKIQIPMDKPVLVRQKNGNTCFGCGHKTPDASGIVVLKFTPPDSFTWDGQTYLLCVEGWREIVPEDLKQFLPGTPRKKS